jgi:hypothetical protein
MNNPPSSNPDSIQPVRVHRHIVDWEASDLDLAELTAQRAVTLAPQIAAGCWFLNPRYTVSSPAPTAEFFRTVVNLRSTWLRTCPSGRKKRQTGSDHADRPNRRPRPLY